MAKRYTNKRLSESPGRPPREWSPRERYVLYRRGFRAGAGIRPIESEAEGIEAYDRGYDDGVAALGKASARYAKRVGYVPEVLRLAGTKGKA